MRSRSEKRSRAAVASNAALALSVVLLPWYSLGGHEPTGWDATWWARLALACALINLVLLKLRTPHSALRILSGLAFAATVYRFMLPPDFGFAFDGLEVPTGREAGVYVALCAAALSLLAGSGRSAALRSGPAAAPR